MQKRKRKQGEESRCNANDRIRCPKSAFTYLSRAQPSELPVGMNENECRRNPSNPPNATTPAFTSATAFSEQRNSTLDFLSPLPSPPILLPPTSNMANAMPISTMDYEPLQHHDGEDAWAHVKSTRFTTNRFRRYGLYSVIGLTAAAVWGFFLSHTRTPVRTRVGPRKFTDLWISSRCTPAKLLAALEQAEVRPDGASRSLPPLAWVPKHFEFSFNLSSPCDKLHVYSAEEATDLLGAFGGVLVLGDSLQRLALTSLFDCNRSELPTTRSQTHLQYSVDGFDWPV